MKRSIRIIVYRIKERLNKFSIRLIREKILRKNYVDNVIRCNKRLFRKNGYNICYNKSIPEDYDPNKKNILLAIESPEVVEYEGWLKPDMKFYAEISFANYYKLKNYHCCRTLYVGHDGWVDLDINNTFDNKNELVSMIYSTNNHLSGHKMRRDIADTFGERIDLFGSGTGKYLEKKIESLADYMFQIVVENGKYPEYVSEKFFDCIKTRTIPIYRGGEEGLRKMGFDPEGVLYFDSFEELDVILKENVSSEIYKTMLPHAINNLNRLVELRNEYKFNFYINTILSGYLHSTASGVWQQKSDYTRLNLGLD